MFMKQDGKFTRRNVNMNEGESICVVVILGPIPAVSAIKPLIHYGPSDSIIMTAKSSDSDIHLSIILQEHHQYSNMYYASVKFVYHGIYSLETSTEYRSYFWEHPIFHAYRPNRYTSYNTAIVHKVSKVIIETEEPSTDDNTVTFVPDGFCDIKPLNEKECLGSKNIHVWGDESVSRNIKCLDKEQGDCADTLTKSSLLHKSYMLEGYNSTVYYRPIDSSIVNEDTLTTFGRHIQQVTMKLPLADMVILSVGNIDLCSSRQSPNEFAESFYLLLEYLVNEVYQDQPIIVKSTQYISGRLLDNITCNYGRSLAYNNIVKAVVSSIASERVKLWDVHQLGLYGHNDPDSMYSPPELIKVENALLCNIMCSA
ncbi:hypothetical protein BDB01DRAFT_335453 [Pilobolus umbonatus]|nr:hypothetical protein BDB01DRAFT_335453 [Pilobolus umbonatus]